MRKGRFYIRNKREFFVKVDDLMSSFSLRLSVFGSVRQYAQNGLKGFSYF